MSKKNKIRVNAKDNGTVKKIIFDLPSDKPIVIDDKREKGPGLVFLTGIEYDGKKDQTYATGIDLADKKEYRKSVSSVYSNSKIEFISEKDAKFLAKELGKCAALVSCNKKIPSDNQTRISGVIKTDFESGIEEFGDDAALTEAFEKSFNKVIENKGLDIFINTMNQAVGLVANEESFDELEYEDFEGDEYEDIEEDDDYEFDY